VKIGEEHIGAQWFERKINGPMKSSFDSIELDSIASAGG
jgi:hypothetical protein